MRAEVCREAGDLPAPTRNARQSWARREGLILTLHDTDGLTGHGEASPLPGYSIDDLESCRVALEGLDPSDPDVDLPPAARFALETALLDLAGKRAGRPAWKLLASHRPVPPLLLTAVVSSLTEAARAYARGIRTFKVKIGACLPDEMALLHALRQRHGTSVRLRLDANQSLQPGADLEALARLAPEFLEEPGTDLGACPVPLALDESLQHTDALESLPIRYVVLKPMALGGIARCRALARRAEAAGIRVVVSHLLDGPIALAACAALAAAIQTPGVACGLDRHPGLAAFGRRNLDWLLPDRIDLTARPGLGIDL